MTGVKSISISSGKKASLLGKRLPTQDIVADQVESDEDIVDRVEVLEEIKFEPEVKKEPIRLRDVKKGDEED